MSKKIRQVELVEFVSLIQYSPLNIQIFLWEIPRFRLRCMVKFREVFLRRCRHGCKIL